MPVRSSSGGTTEDARTTRRDRRSALTRHLRRGDAPWLDPDPHAHRAASLLVVLAVWALAWGWNTLAAVGTLAGVTAETRLDSQAARWVWFVVTDLIPTLPVLVVGLALIPAAARRAVWPFGTRGPRAASPVTLPGGRTVRVPHPELLAGSAWSVAFLAGLAVVTLTGALTGRPAAFPADEPLTGPGLVRAVVGSVLAGPTEEILFGAVFVTLLRRGGWSWPVIVALAGLLRGSFHVYYGWPSIGFFLWGALAAVGYALSGRVALPALLHSAWNLRSTLAGAWGEEITWLGAPLFLAAVAVLLAVVAAGCPRRVRGRHVDAGVLPGPDGSGGRGVHEGHGDHGGRGDHGGSGDREEPQSRY